MITPKQTRFLSHVLAFVKAGGTLAGESIKRSPKAVHWAMTTKGGAFAAGAGVGAYGGYRAGRRLQNIAYGYANPRER